MNELKKFVKGLDGKSVVIGAIIGAILFGRR